LEQGQVKPERIIMAIKFSEMTRNDIVDVMWQPNTTVFHGVFVKFGYNNTLAFVILDNGGYGWFNASQVTVIQHNETTDIKLKQDVSDFVKTLNALIDAFSEKLK
jgi:hypothetical protein